jgi:tricorn protease
MFCSRITTIVLLACASGAGYAREAKLVRYPSYHQGRVAFTYLGDIWTADENGGNVQRITANPARDVYARFSPDGKWIAFSSDRNGNLDVYIVPSEGGQAKQLTFHSAEDQVVGWTPDSRSVLFSSNRGEDFMPKLYLVSIDGGMERSAGADMGVWASYSPDGKRLALNRKSQVYWRKYYRGAYNSDVTIMDVATKKFTDVTNFDGMDAWPMWASDGHIYFVSDREGAGLTNIWRVSDKGGQAERITSFKTGDVRWPSISSDGKTIVFEHDFGVMKLDVASRKVTPIKLNINAETEDNLVEVRSFASKVDDYDLAPSGRRIAFSIHGEIFTAPVEEGDVVQVTDNPARDRQPRFSPDGKQMAFVSDRSGREEIYVVAADGSGDPQKVTDIDALKFTFRWSPDSKQIAFTTSDSKLIKYDLTSKQSVEITSSKYGQINGALWSPDGKWIAYSKSTPARNTNIYLAPAAGGPEHKATFESLNDINPRFSPDGKKLYFERIDGSFGGGGNPPSAQIYVIPLERQDRDPDEPDERAELTDSATDQPAAAGRRALQPQPITEAKIDWAGLKRRTKQVTRMPYPVNGYGLAPDNKTIIFAVNEITSQRPAPAIYSIQDSGKRLTRLSVATPPAEGENPEEDRRGGGGFGPGGGREFHFTRDGRSVFFEEAGSVYSIPLPPSVPVGAPAERAATAATPTGAPANAPRRRVNFNVKVRVNKPAEWAEMFDDAWRTMKYRFYDPKMHGFDWDGARAKYQPLVEFVGDRQELLNIVNEMIGELNASHTGAAAPIAARTEGAFATGHLGLDLEADEKAGRYRVTHIYEDGPADKDWVRVSEGDYLIAIDGKPIIAGDNYWKLLNYRLNRKVAVSFNKQPTEDGAWKTRIEPITPMAFNQLRYERWVKQRRELVDKLSDGKVGYLHIQAMNPPSLHKFEKEIRENRDKQALIIDQRWNGGGNIEQELLAILVQRQYQIWQPRGTEPSGRPFAGFFGPKVVLQNWRSASNAEMFPAGFRDLKLGQLIGTPTLGAVIGTGSYSLIDGSTVRTPGVGVYLADQKHTNMENYGVKPDIYVENSAEDNLAGRDRQVERAVQELLKELGGKKELAKN